MSDTFWATLPLTITSIATLITAIMTMFRLKKVHKEINGMKTELVRSTAKASKAEGRAEGVKEEQNRIK